MALNPDFSEIGTDDPKVQVNQRYEVIFPEWRPFFIENASIFSTPEQVFFSCRIVNPQFGLKLTGSLDRWSVGAWPPMIARIERFWRRGRTAAAIGRSMVCFGWSANSLTSRMWESTWTERSFHPLPIRLDP
jgi:hypothetical protein